MGARSKKIWIDISGENQGRSFGGESASLDICVGTSASYSKKICEVNISSYESSDGSLEYTIRIDGQEYRRTTFDKKSKDFGKIKGKKINGNPMVQQKKEKKSNDSFLKTVSVIASIGDIFCDNQKDKNDWKKRMLVAGIPEGVLHMPEDWDQLSEDEKQKRLDGAIAILGEDPKEK